MSNFAKYSTKFNLSYIVAKIAIQRFSLYLWVRVNLCELIKSEKMRRGFADVSLEGRRSHRMRNTEKRKRVWMQFAAVDRDDRAERR